MYELPLLAHATMEPMNCTADVKADRCDVYVGTQVQQLTQAAAAEAAGLKPDQVNVHTTLLGGGFGRRLEVDFVPAAVAASKAVGAPVKLIWTREDDMTHDLYRPPAREAVSAGLDEHGKLTRLDAAYHRSLDHGALRSDQQGSVRFGDRVRAELSLCRAELRPDAIRARRSASTWAICARSATAPNCFAIESSIDEIAALASKDPLQLRRELLAGKPRHLQVLKIIAERVGLGPCSPRVAIRASPSWKATRRYIAQVAEVSIEAGELKVHRITCVIDCGQTVNPRIVESQLESGIVYGLSAALWGDITLRGGRVQQRNFNDYRVLRLHETPALDVHILPSDAKPGGIGETGVPPVAPALCNAIFAATGKRLRSLPIAAHRLT